MRKPISPTSPPVSKPARLRPVRALPHAASIQRDPLEQRAVPPSTPSSYQPRTALEARPAPAVFSPNASPQTLLQQKPGSQAITRAPVGRPNTATQFMARATVQRRKASPSRPTSYQPKPAVEDRPAPPVFRPGAAPQALIQQKPGTAVNAQHVAGRNASVAQPMLSAAKSFLGLGGQASSQPAAKSDEELRRDSAMTSVKLVEAENPQLIIIWGSLSVPILDLKGYLEKYRSGMLTLYRGVQQCHPMFPKGNDYRLMVPKKPGSKAPPDFAGNENAWLPMTPTQKLAMDVVLSWSLSIIGYFQKSGGIDASRPVGLVLEKRVAPKDAIAFCFDDEIQIMGPCYADRVTEVWIEDDLGKIRPEYTGESFLKWADAAKLPILNQEAMMKRMVRRTILERNLESQLL